MFKVFQTVFVVLMMWAGASHAATTVNVDCSTGTVAPASPPQDTEVTIQLAECNNNGIAATLSNVVAEFTNGAQLASNDSVLINQIAGCGPWAGPPAPPPCSAIKITSVNGGTYSFTFKDSQGATKAGPVSGSISASGGGSGGGGSAATPVPALPLWLVGLLGLLVGLFGLRRLRQ